jgi:hypothetical protein
MESPARAKHNRTETMPEPTLLAKLNCDSGGELSVEQNYFHAADDSPVRAKMPHHSRLPPILNSVDFSGGPASHLQSTKNSGSKKMIAHGNPVAPRGHLTNHNFNSIDVRRN